MHVRDVEEGRGFLGEKHVMIHVAGNVEDGARRFRIVVVSMAVLTDLLGVSCAEEVKIILAEVGVVRAGAVELCRKKGGDPGTGGMERNCCGLGELDGWES